MNKIEYIRIKQLILKVKNNKRLNLIDEESYKELIEEYKNKLEYLLNEIIFKKYNTYIIDNKSYIEIINELNE